MGFFSSIFGKKEAPLPFDMEPTAALMDEDQFWKLVAESLDRSGNDQNAQIKALTDMLEKLEPSDIVGFRLRTDKLLHDTYNSKTWCAGYIMNGGCSDDAFEYFRLWIISRGREVYENAKADPDSLIAVADTEVPEGLFYFEPFWYVALEAFKNKTGKDLYDFIDYDNFPYGEGNYEQFDFDWEEENPDSMKALCPKLFERFEDK